MKKKVGFEKFVAGISVLSGMLWLSASLCPVQTQAAVDGAREVMHYNRNEAGGSWDGEHYRLADNTMVTDAFFCDGTDTYYLQSDGTPMKDCLTYHPDGEHIIYFNRYGHEAFDAAEHITRSIEGETVDDDCYFGTYGYMYQDEVAYRNDVPMYYNKNGVLQKSSEFTFSDGNLGVADGQGQLSCNGFGYNAFGQIVFFQWNGTIAKGLITDGAYYYQMSETDGTLQGAFPAEGVSGTAIPADASLIGPQQYDLRLMGNNPITNEITDYSGGGDVTTFMDERYKNQYWRLDIYKDTNGNVINSVTGESGSYATLRGITIGSTKEQVHSQYGDPMVFGYDTRDQGLTAYDTNDWYRIKWTNDANYATDWLEKMSYETWGIRFTYDENQRVSKISYQKYPIMVTEQEMLSDSLAILERWNIRDMRPELVAKEGELVTLNAAESKYAQEGCSYQWREHTAAGTYTDVAGATASTYQLNVPNDGSYYMCTITQADGKKYDVLFPVMSEEFNSKHAL